MRYLVCAQTFEIIRKASLWISCGKLWIRPAMMAGVCTSNQGEISCPRAPIITANRPHTARKLWGDIRLYRTLRSFHVETLAPGRHSPPKCSSAVRGSASLANGLIDNYPCEILPHWQFAPSERTGCRHSHHCS